MILLRGLKISSLSNYWFGHAGAKETASSDRQLPDAIFLQGNTQRIFARNPHAFLYNYVIMFFQWNIRFKVLLFNAKNFPFITSQSIVKKIKGHFLNKIFKEIEVTNNLEIDYQGIKK